MEGLCNSPDLPGLIALLADNEKSLGRMAHTNALHDLALKFLHWQRRNSRKGSRKNIHAHYDLGNEFYRLWLDPTMTYSSALFDGTDGKPLEAAQTAKYERILEQIGAKQGDSILEIGCGWGGFAETAARRGMRVTGVTISQQQLEYARARLRARRPQRPGRLPVPRLSRHGGALRPHRVDRDDRGGGRALLARLLRGPEAACRAGRLDPGAGDRHRRRLLRELPPPSGFHTDLRLPGRHAAVAHQPARAVPPGRPEGRRALQFRPGLCAYPGDVARPLRPGRRPGGENGLRRPVSAACGATTSPIAPPASRPAARTYCRPTSDIYNCHQARR